MKLGLPRLIFAVCIASVQLKALALNIRRDLESTSFSLGGGGNGPSLNDEAGRQRHAKATGVESWKVQRRGGNTLREFPPKIPPSTSQLSRRSIVRRAPPPEEDQPPKQGRIRGFFKDKVRNKQAPSGKGKFRATSDVGTSASYQPEGASSHTPSEVGTSASHRQNPAFWHPAHRYTPSDVGPAGSTQRASTSRTSSSDVGASGSYHRTSTLDNPFPASYTKPTASQFGHESPPGQTEVGSSRQEARPESPTAQPKKWGLGSMFKKIRSSKQQEPPRVVSPNPESWTTYKPSHTSESGSTPRALSLSSRSGPRPLSILRNPGEGKEFIRIGTAPEHEPHDEEQLKVLKQSALDGYEGIRKQWAEERQKKYEQHLERQEKKRVEQERRERMRSLHYGTSQRDVETASRQALRALRAEEERKQAEEARKIARAAYLKELKMGYSRSSEAMKPTVAKASAQLRASILTFSGSSLTGELGTAMRRKQHDSKNSQTSWKSAREDSSPLGLRNDEHTIRKELADARLKPKVKMTREQLWEKAKHEKSMEMEIVPKWQSTQSPNKDVSAWTYGLANAKEDRIARNAHTRSVRTHYERSWLRKETRGTPWHRNVYPNKPEALNSKYWSEQLMYHKSANPPQHEMTTSGAAAPAGEPRHGDAALKADFMRSRRSGAAAATDVVVDQGRAIRDEDRAFVRHKKANIRPIRSVPEDLKIKAASTPAKSAQPQTAAPPPELSAASRQNALGATGSSMDRRVPPDWQLKERRVRFQADTGRQLREADLRRYQDPDAVPASPAGGATNDERFPAGKGSPFQLGERLPKTDSPPDGEPRPRPPGSVKRPSRAYSPNQTERGSPTADFEY